jgi:hypothetical protein
VRLAVWIILGAWATVVTAAFAARVPWAPIMPSPALIIMVFLAKRWEAPKLCLAALCLGHMVGGVALSPPGLHELALVLVALGVFVVSGNLSATGSTYAGWVTGFAALVHHLIVLLLMVWQGDSIGLSSWATALFVPQAIVTGLCAWALYPVLVRIDVQLTPRGPEGLQWR